MTVRWHQGRLAELIDIIAGVSAANPGVPAYRGAHALCLVEADRYSDARLLLEREMASNFEHPNDLPLGAHLMLWSEVAGRLGNEAAARTLLPVLRPHTARVVHNGTVSRGAYAHAAGILAATIGDLDSAEGHFGTALRIHERLGAPFLTARTMLEQSRLLLRRGRPGDSGRAEALLANSLDLSERYHCRLVTARAKELQGGQEASL
jgi:ATP/maltotriose-dependent transcriptional regulator MalT